MNKKDLQAQLETFKYPGLERTLGDLKLIDSVKVAQNRATIILSTVSEESYLAIKAGIIDTFSVNFDAIDVQQKMAPAQDKNYGDTKAPNNRAPYAKNIIAVTSGKGGVGKTTVSVNIAIGLAQEGYRVGILDADIYGPNVPRLLGVDLQRMKWNDNNKIIPSENFGIKLMSVALTTPTMDTPLVWRSSVAISALLQFLEDVEWGELDFLVIDMPPGTGDIQLTMAEELPITASVLVTTPQIVALDDVSRAIMMFKDIKVPMAGIVENMSYFIAPDTKIRYDIFGKGGGERTATKYEIPFLGQIPLETEIRENSDMGEPTISLGSDENKVHYKNIVSNLLNSKLFNI